MTRTTGSSDGEQLLFVTDEHWIKYVFPAFVYLIVTAGAVLIFVLAGVTAHHQMWLSHASLFLGLLMLLLAHHWFFHTLLSESSDRIIVTNKRVIHLRESLLFSDVMKEISIDKVKMVAAEKGNIFQTVFRYGTVVLNPMDKIHRVPHPHRTARAIEQALGMI